MTSRTAWRISMEKLSLGYLLLLGACGSNPERTNELGTGGTPSGVGGTGGANVAMGGSAGSGGTTTSGGTRNETGGSSTGGSSGGSSGGGSGGTPSNVTPVTCDSGADEVGVWQNIDPPEFAEPTNMETYSVIVNPLDGTVYAAAGNKTNGGNGGTGVFKSTDCGGSFFHVSTGTNGDKLSSGGLWAMMIDPVNPDTLYVANGYGNDPTIYRSTNGGVDFTALAPHPDLGTNSFVQDIALEHAAPSHLTVNFHDACNKDGFNSLCFSNSTDAGATWALFNGPSALTGWYEGASLAVLGPTTYFYTCTAGGWFTSDQGANWSKVIDEGFNASYGGVTVLAPSGTLYAAGSGAIYKSNSTPLGQSWTKIDGSPRAMVITHDGAKLIASNNTFDASKPFWSAPLDDDSTWTNMDSPEMERGSNAIAYDPTHHIVYAANWSAGLWRLVTE